MPGRRVELLRSGLRVLRRERRLVFPDRCQSYFDDYMLCLDGIASPATAASCGSCSSEQTALFGCD